ncbi:pyruvate, water dikinase regulatory protein [Ignavigranum ruoffiae]|uniref:Putative pyruvate, phosphate dikinase regulatory protein n=1 Tax=Ignavigranum ruoffiae TaxID=89093 RepID=A0A1H8ZWN8_9LACT|nr:pyruvate, water dikinase regulatory protein [Ignavigranum ruoffiae]UPQ85672.1 kinase/pyrophosphorylase [Ignavigranum ruoffiae]SEP68683.1 hypothetical protein SAMN04488558_101356 [Ignavigranum ruoffiae]
MVNKTLHYYILSDSIGETALKVARSALSQFPTAHTVLHKYNFISNKAQLKDIIDHAQKHDGLLFMTIVDPELAQFVEKACIETGLICYNLIQPFILEIQRRLDLKPSTIAGAQHELSEQYFARVKAIEFCIHYDDGKDLSGLDEAEIVLLGISRTGKTPLSMYLGTLGYKVLNLPIMPEKEVSPELYSIDPNKIIGLTNEVDVINRHREKRMAEYGLGPGSHYASKERIEEELTYARKLYQDLGCRTLNVADRSIEESASIILDMLGLTPR